MMLDDKGSVDAVGEVQPALEHEVVTVEKAEPVEGNEIDEDYEGDEEENGEDDEDDEDNGDMVIRAKWLMDGAATLPAAAQQLRDAAADLEGLHAEGWVLRNPIQDDYGFLYKPENGEAQLAQED